MTTTGLVFACIAPHGGEVIPELAGDDPGRMAATRTAMAELGRRMAAAQPETVVVITPHGIRIDGQICVSVSERAEGNLGEVALDLEVDSDLGNQIADAAVTHGIPVARAIYGASGGPSCCIPLDWGAIVPLYFMQAARTVVIVPSRSLDRTAMVEFGKALAEAAQRSGKRVALIASADWAHAHAADGPYGYDPAAQVLDGMVCQAVRDGALEQMLAFDDALVEEAKPDGIWQALMLHGALQVVPMKGELLSYEAPTYFGMLCAAYTPI
jgi:aromatic ring-opening dioxygenase LigB subunit